MPNPRNTVSRRETYPKQELTFVADGTSIVYAATAAKGSAVAGRAVAINDGVASLVGDGGRIGGELILVEPDGKCTVKTQGVCLLPAGTGATFTAGGGVVGALLAGVSGYVKGASPATLAEVAAQRGRVLDDTTTTAIEVLLT